MDRVEWMLPKDISLCQPSTGVCLDLVTNAISFPTINNRNYFPRLTVRYQVTQVRNPPQPW